MFMHLRFSEQNFPSKKKYGAGQVSTHLYRIVAIQHSDPAFVSSSKKVTQLLGQVFSLHPAELKSYGSYSQFLLRQG